MGMFFKDSPVAIVKCEKCCKRNIQILFFSSPNQLRDYFALPWKQCAKYEKKIGKKTQKCVVCENWLLLENRWNAGCWWFRGEWMSQVVIWGWWLKYWVCIFYTKYTQCQSIICIVSYTGGPRWPYEDGLKYRIWIFYTKNTQSQTIICNMYRVQVVKLGW